MRTHPIAATIGVLLSSCADAAPTVESLTRPSIVLTFSENQPLCTTIVALDGNNDVWDDVACEREFQLGHVRRVTQAERSAINATLQALPAPSGIYPRCDLHFERQFDITQRLSRDSASVWAGCKPISEPPDEPYLDAFIAIREADK